MIEGNIVWISAIFSAILGLFIMGAFFAVTGFLIAILRRIYNATHKHQLYGFGMTTTWIISMILLLLFLQLIEKLQ